LSLLFFLSPCLCGGSAFVLGRFKPVSPQLAKGGEFVRFLLFGCGQWPVLWVDGFNTCPLFALRFDQLEKVAAVGAYMRLGHALDALRCKASMVNTRHLASLGQVCVLNFPP
jgi:hypothetical protein